MIPKTIHFLYGLAPDWQDLPFSYVHYLAILSAKVINPSYEVVMHYHYEPQSNEWWERCKTLAKMNKLPVPPTHLGGKRIKHCAHVADVLRIEILLAEGGVYLDIDTICIKSFDPLLTPRLDRFGVPRATVMGLEVCDGNVNGLCNAVILSERDSEFLRRWQRRMVGEFDPDDWNKCPVRLPFEISRNCPDKIHVEPSESFFRLTYLTADLKLMHEGIIEFNNSYSQHLWEHSTFEKYLKHITEKDVMERDCTYSRLVRNVLNEARTQRIL